MGILILLASVFTGYCLVKQFLDLQRPFVSFCGAALVGGLLSGTLLYLLDLLSVVVATNYFAGTFIYLAIAAAYLIYSYRRNILEAAKSDISDLQKDKAAIAAFVVFFVFSLGLCCYSFSVTAKGDIMVYNGAWSDIIYHHAYVRSVVFGENIPIQYPYFINEPIHYHFLFNYYAGKISQLGLHSVTAYNTISVIGMVCLLMLIFELGRVCFKSSLTGFLGALFLIFHGSLSVFPWLRQNFDNKILQKVFEKNGWLIGARFEDWGLFNLNVFVNQRHLPFTLAFLVLLVIFVYQYLGKLESAETPPETVEAERFSRYGIDFDKLKLPLFWIVVFGAMPFWNVLVAVIGIMFLGAFAFVHYKNRNLLIGFLLTAAVSFLIVYPQLQLYKSGNSVLTEYPKFHFGYGAAESSLFDFFLYYLIVLGIKLILMLAALLLVNWRLRWYFLIFLIPFLIANVFQLGTVLYDNNKLIVASLIFANCYAAYSIVWLLQKSRRYAALPAIILILTVTLAGIIDFFAVYNYRQTEITDDSSKLKQWIIANTKPKAVFLTNDLIPYHDTAINAINLAGRYLYAVSSCVNSSCNVEPRMNLTRKIYSFSGGDAEKIKSLLAQEQIDFVVIDNLVRENAPLKLNEAAFEKNFELVYQESGVKIYQVSEGENKSGIQSSLPNSKNKTEEIVEEVVNAFGGGAGKGRGQFSKPRGIAVDAEGNFYVADAGNSRVQKFAPSGEFLALIGKKSGTGTGELRAPRGIAVDAAGDVYVSDEQNNRLMKFKADGTFVKEWNGLEPDGFLAPRDLAIAANKEVYILDTGRARVVRFDPQSENFTIWKQGNTEEGDFSSVTGLTASGERIYIADAKNNRVSIFDLEGKFVGQLAVPQWDKYIWHYPDIAVDEKAKQAFVTSGWSSEVLVFSLEGKFVRSIKPEPPATFNNVSSIAFSDTKSGQRLYVLNTGSDVVETGESNVSVFELETKDNK